MLCSSYETTGHKKKTPMSYVSDWIVFTEAVLLCESPIRFHSSAVDFSCSLATTARTPLDQKFQSYAKNPLTNKNGCNNNTCFDRKMWACAANVVFANKIFL